jgi:hypothetical protein
MITLRSCLLAGIFILLTAGLTAAEKIIPDSYNFKQVTNGKGGVAKYSDPNFKKLTDGVTDDKNNLCMWNRRECGRMIDITFNFADPVKLSEAKIHLYRDKKGFPLQKITVVAVDENDASIPLGYIDPKLPYSNEGEAFSVLSIPLDPGQNASQVSVRIGYDSHFAATEIEFFGEKGEKKVSNSLNPFPALASSEKTGLRLIEKDMNGDGAPEIIMENDRAIYVLEPACAGVLNFAYDKSSGSNFIKPAGKTEHGGMFYDRFYPTGRNAFNSSEYSYKVLENSKDKLSVELSANGKGGMFDEVSISKIFILLKDSIALRVDYTVSNSQANVVPINCGLWISSGIHSNEKFDMIYRGELDAVRKPATVHEPYSSAPGQPWCAILTESEKGLALLTDFELLKRFIFWGKDPVITTMEAQLGVFEIKAADKFSTTAYLIPFSGIGFPDNITASMAGRFMLKDVYDSSKNTANLKLFPVQAGKYRIKIFAGPVEKGKAEFKLLTEKELALGSQIEDLSFETDFTKQGTWAFKVMAERDGNSVFTAESVTAFKTSSGNYVFQPPSEKRPENLEKAQSMDLNFNSMSYVTPHLEWAKPYAGGKPSVLLIGEGASVVRDMIEVAERCDIDLTVNYIGGVYSISGLYSSLSVPGCFNELAKRLVSKYDAIVVAGDVWSSMPESIKNTIVLQVKEGTGLLLTSPVSPPPAIAKHYQPDKLSPKPQAWSVSAEHPVISGIPFNALPPTITQGNKTDGEVILKAGKDALLTLFNLEKGKVAVAGWKVNTGKDSPYTVLPQMPNSLSKNIDYPYWEYQISLLGKIIYYIADKKSNITLNKIAAAHDGKFTAEVSADKPQKASVELTVSDKFHNKLSSVSHNVDLKAGKNNVEVNFKPQTQYGLIFVDMIVKGDSGVETWGTCTFDNPAESYIKDFRLDPKVWKREESLAVEVQINNPNNSDLTLQLFDSYGNEFARQESKAAETVSFSVPLKDCKAYTFDALLTIRKDGRTLDSARQTLALYGIPDTRIMQVAFGWPSLSSRSIQSFMLKPYYERLMEMGATVLRPHGTDSPFELMEGRKLGMPYIYSRSPGTCDSRYPNDPKTKAKTKFDMIRKPCISAPGFKDMLEEKNSKLANLEDFGSIIRGGPDEANSIKKWDGCFSIDCQRELREYLKRKYGSLEALNQSWATDFKQWDDVIAMTSEEVKNHPSFAPWHDHRTFNDWTRADAIHRIAKGTKAANPQLCYSLSGTHNTNPFNAYDWYLLMKEFDAIESYSGEQTIMQRSFHENGKLIWMPWIGYDSNYDSVNQLMLNYLMEGATAFSIFSGKFYVNPDLTLPIRGQEMQKLMNRFKNGPAELLINSKYSRVPIAMHYSPASIKTDWILGWDDHALAAVQGMATMLYDMGLGYDYVAYGNLETDNRLDEYKVFILPGSSSLSPKEVASIKAFVKNGGTVIADMLPGAYDQNGKPCAVNPLLDLFGVKDIGKLIIGNAVINGTDTNLNGLTLKNYEGKLKSFSMGVIPDSGKALAKVDYQEKEYPAVIVNSYGKGRAVYFAAAISTEYGELAEMRFAPSRQPHIAALNGFMGKLISDSGVKPEIRVMRPDGKPIRVSKTVVRHNGPAIMLGVVRNYRQALNIDTKPITHKVELPGEYYVYDLLERKELGRGSSFDYEFSPQTQALFALLPYKVKNIEVKIQRNDGNVKINMNAVADVKEPADHIFRIEIISPSGKANAAFSTMLFGKGLAASHEFAMPLNAEPGDWKVNVTDALSGVTASEIISKK